VKLEMSENPIMVYIVQQFCFRVLPKSKLSVVEE